MARRKKVRVLKRPPRGFSAVDPARDLTQARSLAKSYPPENQVVIVKTGKRGDVFPYTTYLRGPDAP